MKNIVFKIITVFTLFLMINCQDDKASFGDLSSPNNLTLSSLTQGVSAPAFLYGDGSGFVTFSAKADNTISYKYIFSDESISAPSGVYKKRFTNPGTNKYVVTVIASGKGGLSTSKTIEVEVFFEFKDDQAVTLLTGDSQKNWYWAASEVGHLGEGSNNTDMLKNWYAHNYESVAFNSNTTCLYDDVLTFTKTSTGGMRFQYNNNGSTLINRQFLSVVGLPNSNQYVDSCQPYSGPAVTGIKNVTLTPSESLANPLKKRGTVMNFSDNGFMGFYFGETKYEIMSLTSSRMVVRSVQEAFTPSGAPNSSAWYHIFTSIQPTQDSTDFTNLVWADEFNVNGAPDTTKWSYDLGAGGWGNGEQQSYTNSPNNVVVQGGNLKITAIKDQISNTYTSARLKTQGKKQFTYGKVVCRAKLPAGAGTWPAIWMLGANFSTNVWPACGEIDIMEHKGSFPDVIHGSLHYPGRFAGNANTNTTTITGASANYHDYKVIWSANSIRFFVDDVLFHTLVNNGSLPFNSDFFLILNVAMGGTFGGPIANGFTQSSMEVDYIRLYQ